MTIVKPARRARRDAGDVNAIALMLLAALGSPSTANAELQERRTGQQVVEYQCALCHKQGVGGAPKIGDAKAWQQRVSARSGVDGLLRSAQQGRGAMPPKGGLSDLSDEELRAAIAYMLGKS